MKPRIYLAGGFKGGWQNFVIENLGDEFIYFNPQTHKLDKVDQYTSWDLYHVEKCDILLGYMSEDNPSGYGLALEIGYAKAKNKLVVLVDNRSKNDEKFKRYFSICHESSTVVLKNLEEAIGYLKRFIV